MDQNDDHQRLMDLCAEIDKVTIHNIDLFPISFWGFDSDITEDLREMKHSAVSEAIEKGKARGFNKVNKQQLAKDMGIACRTVTDVFSWLAKHRSNIRPTMLTKQANRKAIKESNSAAKKDDKESDDEEVSAPSKNANKKSSVKGMRKDQKNKKRKLLKEEKHETDDSEGSSLAKRKRPEKRIAAHSRMQDCNDEVLASREAAMCKLKQKIDTLKQKRLGKKTPEEYERKRKMKRRLSKMKLKQERGMQRQKSATNNSASKSTVDNSSSKCDEPKKHDVSTRSDENKVVFSKLNFNISEKKMETKKEKRDKFVGKDYKRLLQKVEKRDKKLASLRERNPAKYTKVEENIQWNKALSRAEGRKVKDNPELLKKSLQKKEKIVEWRKKKWSARVESMEEKQKKKQEKRDANIQARKDDVKKRKLQRARKKGRIL